MGFYLHLTVSAYIVCLFVSASRASYLCPENCVCKHNPPKESVVWIRARCGDAFPVVHLDELDFSNIYTNLLQLNLTQNRLASFNSKWTFSSLQKLDISHNSLTVLRNNQFIQVPNVKRLDVSRNNIERIESLAFFNLNHLERLKLDYNRISSIEANTFNPLASVKQLDISNNPLKCDCDLLWMLEWSKEYSVKLSSNPKCDQPPTFKGILLRKLRVGEDIHCKSRAGNSMTPVLKTIPDQNQIVFEGDSLTLYCEAQNVPMEAFETSDARALSRVEWLWFETDPKDYFEDLDSNVRYVTETNTIIGSLTIPSLNVNHSGDWSCKLNYESGNYSLSISLVVISDDTRFCSAMMTNDNKGSYVWPTTIINNTVYNACESVRPNSDISQQKASLFCSSSGTWADLNTSACSYVSESTRILEQFSKVDSNLTEVTVFESLRHFKNYTSNLQIFRDTVDLLYVLKTIENYINYLHYKENVCIILMEILNKLLELPYAYLARVNSVQQGIFKKMTDLVENIARHSSDSNLHKPNLAFQKIAYGQVYSGTTCTWYINDGNDWEQSFYCISSDQPDFPDIQDRLIKASIHIPASSIYETNKRNVVLGRSIQKMLVVMYDDGKLFPVKKKNHNVYIESSVVGAKLVNTSITTEMTDPIYVVLHIPQKGSSSDYIPAWWNSSADNYRGNWSTEDCRLNYEIRDNAVFYCKRLGYYGLIRKSESFYYNTSNSRFRLSHPAIYVGTLYLFVSLLVVILSYCVFYVSIQMPKKAKHSLINMWIAVDSLVFVYVFGIYQTEDVYLCQIIGLSMHYFTLCSLLWMCIGVTTIYKRLNKNDGIELRDDQLAPEMPIQKPILGLYLIGWGVASIICGISGAVNMKEYSVRDRCFLSWTPTLSALFVPAIGLLLILMTLFMLIRCTIYNLDASGHLSEGTQVTENVDLDMLEPSFPAQGSLQSLSSFKTRSSEMEDAEHAPLMQLKAYVIFLILYLAAWFSCALSTVKLFKFHYEEDLFAIIYAICTFALGSFTVFFYCVARNDVRSRWLLLHNVLEKRGVWFRSRNISDTNQNIPRIQIGPPSQIVCQSPRCSSRSSSRTKSNSDNGKVVNNLNERSSVEDSHGARINDVNLVVLHRRQYRNNVATNLIENPANTAHMFYNPYQSTVARRFFRKQRQHTAKCNNLPLRKYTKNDAASVLSAKQASEDSYMDHHIFGTNSKVNNKNIHVEKERQNKNKNVNVFSDSREELNLNHLPVDKLMMNAERLRKRELNRPRIRKKHNTPCEITEVILKQDNVFEETNMRTVSQQCSLEYSSDSLSSKSRDERVMRIEHVPKRRHKKSKLKGGHNPRSHSAVSVANSCGSEDESTPKVYANRSEDLIFSDRVQNRTGSISTSELDELYQQIRRGATGTSKVGNLNASSFNSRLSDPEISLSLRGVTNKTYATTAIRNLSDDLETVV